MENIIFTDGGGALNGNVVHQGASFADFDIFADDRVGADRYVLGDFRGGCNNGCRMNWHKSKGIIYDILAGKI